MVCYEILPPVMKVIIVKEVMTCDVSLVVMFLLHTNAVLSGLHRSGLQKHQKNLQRNKKLQRSKKSTEPVQCQNVTVHCSIIELQKMKRICISIQYSISVTVHISTIELVHQSSKGKPPHKKTRVHLDIAQMALRPPLCRHFWHSFFCRK